MLPWIVVFAYRLIVPLLILVFPLAGSILAIIADNLDVVILDAMGITDFGFYNSADKFLDTYFYLLQAITLLKWKNIRARNIGWGLFVYRLIGVVIFEVLQYRWLLFVFPNLFLTYYVVYLLIKKIWKKDFVTTWKSTLIFLTLLLIPKLYQEYLWHVVQIPLYDTFRPLIFFWE